MLIAILPQAWWHRKFMPTGDFKMTFFGTFSELQVPVIPPSEKQAANSPFVFFFGKSSDAATRSSSCMF